MKERTALTENVVRYGAAALVCFTISVLISGTVQQVRVNPTVVQNVVTYVAVVIVHMSSDTVARVASLGVAWWLVGTGLLPLTAYWAWRRSVFDRSSD